MKKATITMFEIVVTICMAIVMFLPVVFIAIISGLAWMWGKTQVDVPLYVKFSRDDKRKYNKYFDPDYKTVDDMRDQYKKYNSWVDKKFGNT